MSEALVPVFTKVLDKKYRESEDMKVEAISNLKKNLATLKTKQKTVTMRYATGEIDKAVFNEVHGDLSAEILVAENELHHLEKNISNLSKYISKSLGIASQLGSYWRKGDYKLCQKIQKLTFPSGIKWDGENRCFRTDGENAFLAKIDLVEASAGDWAKKEQDKSCDLSCLVDYHDKLSNLSFIEGLLQLQSFTKGID